MKNEILDRKLRRKKRVSLNIRGTALRPRIAIFRSNRFIYAQAIDDQTQKTITAFSSWQLKKTNQKNSKTNEAKLVGTNLAKLLKDKKIESGIYDRSAYSYRGRVKALAEGLREGGIRI